MDPFSNDPFAADASNTSDSSWMASSATTPAPQGAQPVTATSGQPRYSIKLTLKASAGYDAEWINPWVSGDTAEEAAQGVVELLNALRRHGVIELVAQAAAYTRSQYKGGGASQGGGAPQGGGRSQPASRPATQQGGGTPPGVEQRSCAHGPMVFRTGTNKFGKSYQAFFCPTPPDAQDKCKPIFL